MDQIITTRWPAHEDPASMNAFYGNPDPHNVGEADLQWEAENLIYIAPPYEMFLAWNVGRPLPRIRCHKKVASSLTCALTTIGRQGAGHVRGNGLHLYGGAYMFRPMRGSAKLSIHSWGAAIDLNPGQNALGTRGVMPQFAIDAFAAEGWTWGGDWHRPDPMHFQAADV